jgi:hypothetical protein
MKMILKGEELSEPLEINYDSVYYMEFENVNPPHAVIYIDESMEYFHYVNCSWDCFIKFESGLKEALSAGKDIFEFTFSL